MAFSPRSVEGSIVVPKGAKFGIVASRFNHFIVDHLVGGAVDALARHGAEDTNISVIRVPGAWEIPVVVQRLAKGKKVDEQSAKRGARRPPQGVSGGEGPRAFDAIIALAAVIRGSTPHFDYVAGEVSKGCAMVSLQTGIPVSFGVLTTDTIEQAIERAGTKAGNKGWDAACGAIEMVSLERALEGAGL